MKEFVIKEGVDIQNSQGVMCGFSRIDEVNLIASVSFEKLKRLFSLALDAMKSPIFFFVEVPCTEQEESKLGGGLHKNIYYLDNCTKDVCHAIIKRYGDLLFADGLVEFGFGSHKDNSEIYARKYQVINAYSPDISAFERVFEKSGIEENDSLVTLWDLISEDNPGECCMVEVNSENIYDMIENLTDAGLYLGATVED